MEIDLIRDINEIVAKKWLNQYDIPKPKNKNFLLEFLRWHRLQIPQIKRNVFISKELQQSENNKIYAKEIAFLKNKFENGEDVMPFASKRKKPTSNKGNPYNDYLLNDWGIHHFHLSLQYDKDNTIQRSKDLLFCYIDKENAYFINIYPHSGNWANKELIEIMDNNWSYVLESYDSEIKPISSPSNDERKKFRKDQINCIVTLDNGKSFLTPGGGYTLDGTSSSVQSQHMSIIKQLKLIEKRFKNRGFAIDCKIDSVQLFDCLSLEINKIDARLTNLLFLINNKIGLNIQIQ